MISKLFSSARSMQTKAKYTTRECWAFKTFSSTLILQLINNIVPRNSFPSSSQVLAAYKQRLDTTQENVVFLTQEAAVHETYMCVWDKLLWFYPLQCTICGFIVAHIILDFQYDISILYIVMNETTKFRKTTFSCNDTSMIDSIQVGKLSRTYSESLLGQWRSQEFWSNKWGTRCSNIMYAGDCWWLIRNCSVTGQHLISRQLRPIIVWPRSYWSVWRLGLRDWLLIRKLLASARTYHVLRRSYNSHIFSGRFQRARGSP